MSNSSVVERISGVFLLLLIAGLVAAVAQSPTPATQGRSALESLGALSSQAPAKRVLDIQSWRTQGGAKVLFVRAPELPMLDLRLTFAAGSSQDGEHPGLALLTNAMLNEGAAGQDVTAIAQGFESLGADFGNGAYRDMAIASLRSLSKPELREPALKLFCQVLGEPSFPEEALARIKNQLLASFAQQQKNPAKIASNALMKRLYGDHPYAHPSDGNPASIEAITAQDLVAFHQKAYTAGNTVIALVGNLQRGEAEAIAEQVSQSLPQGPKLAAVAEPSEPKAGFESIDYPSAQTHLLLAELGVDRKEADWPALFLGNQILGGGGFGTRLMEEVREKRGLSYGIYSSFTAMQARGPFTISVQTRAAQSAGTLALVKEILTNYLAKGPTQTELDNAKREVAGSFPLSTASNADIVGQLGAIGFYDLPLDYLDQFMGQVQLLTVEQVREAMAKHLSVDHLVVVSVGPQVAQQPLPEPSGARHEAPLGIPEH